DNIVQPTWRQPGIRMVTPLRPFAITLLLCAAGSAVPARADMNHAGDRCEAAVAETVRRVRGPAGKEVQFVGAKRALTTPNDEEEIGVKGEGRYWSASSGAVSFSYTCAFNAKTGGTSGVLFRETGTTAGGEAAWQPDLSHLSPEACEAATAAVLKDKYPRVG